MRAKIIEKWTEEIMQNTTHEVNKLKRELAKLLADSQKLWEKTSVQENW